MPKTYSTDLRKKTVYFIENGHSATIAAKSFKLHLNTVLRWLKMSQKGFLEDPKPKPRKPKKLNQAELKEFVDQNPDLTIKQIANYFNVWPQAVFYRLNKIKYTYKKRLSLQREMSRKERKVS